MRSEWRDVRVIDRMLDMKLKVLSTFNAGGEYGLGLS